METFLKQVARRIADAHPQDTDRVLVVFNNRRSLRFFQRQFTSLGRTMFLPRMMAIDDLVADLSGLKIVPNEFLLFELYSIHFELEGENRKYKTFDEFISFGDLMMADFSELDQYCVDAADLFGNLHDLKAIGEWDIEEPKLTPFQLDYLHFYRSLYEYYRRLRERLLSQGKAYSGMAYRHAAEEVSGKWKVESGEWEAIYFVGFNALSECERRIIGEYVRRGVGHLLTDGDPYFMEPDQEAGHFLRKHGSEFPSIVPSGPSLFAQGKRRITIVECPENGLQCKLAGHLLSAGEFGVRSSESGVGCCTQITPNSELCSPNSIDNTAVVLADESLMLPCLSALPEGDYSVNISMGFAFCDTGMHLLATRLLSLWRNADRRGYYHSDLLAVLSDRHIGRLLGIPDLRRRTTRFLREGNIIRCPGSEVLAFLGSDTLAFLFQTVGTRRAVSAEECPDTCGHGTPCPYSVEQWLDMMRQLVAAIVDSKMLENNRKELQAAGSLVEVLDYLGELQQTYGYITDLDTLEKIYLRIAQRHQIPLIGEPLSGLQLMGMLETRNLDFGRVILLSAGEGVLPASRSNSSLIPFELKRQFGLPTYQEKDAVYAYNFYHLLLRAEEVYLVYSSESEAMGKGEPSRFIRQVEHELAPRFGIEVKHLVVKADSNIAGSGEQGAGSKLPATGLKNESVMQRLRELAQRGFSPTVFDDYIECPLRYYYTRVLGISSDDALEEDLDASQLGTAIHNVLCDIYAPYNNDLQPDSHRLVEAEGLRRALDELPQYMQREFGSLFLHGRAAEGRNHYLHSVAEAQLRRLLQKEIALLEQGHTLEIVGLEKELGPLTLDEGICIKGKADRIDRFDGRLRIIDYKTGSLQDKEIAYSSTPNRSGEVVVPGKWFQLMCYALLYGQPCSAGIYPLRHLTSDVRLASWDGATDITPAMLADFRAMLTDRCRELMDPSVPFAATAKPTHCHYCAVRTFCPARP